MDRVLAINCRVAVVLVHIVSVDNSADFCFLSLFSLSLLCDAPNLTTTNVGFKSEINFVIVIFFLIYGSHSG